MRAKLYIKFSGGTVVNREISSLVTLMKAHKWIGKHYNVSGKVMIVFGQDSSSGHKYVEQQHITQDRSEGPEADGTHQDSGEDPVNEENTHCSGDRNGSGARDTGERGSTGVHTVTANPVPESPLTAENSLGKRKRSTSSSAPVIAKKPRHEPSTAIADHITSMTQRPD